MNHRRSLFVLTSLALSASFTPVAHAQGMVTITVGPGCTLVQAINSANNPNINPAGTADTGQCAAGQNGTTALITIPAGNPIAFSSASYTNGFNGDAALPAITSKIIIDGKGNTLSRAAGAPAMRFFYIGNPNASLTLSNVVLDGGSSSTGGAISCGAGTLSVTNSTFLNNVATATGGAVTVAVDTGNLCSATITGSTFTKNRATGGGGALGVSGGASLTISNSTLSGNTGCGSGGAIRLESGATKVTATNVTIAGNTTVSGDCNGAGSGGGLSVAQGKVTLKNTIVSGNVANSGGNEIATSTGGTVTGNANNLFGHSGETTAQALSGSITVGPKDFIAASDSNTTALSVIFRDVVNNVPQLSYNGGATETLALARVTTNQRTNGFYTNPAVDSADATNAPTTDQRGSARAVGIGGAADDLGAPPKPDIGAYELVNSNFGGGTPVQFEANNPLANVTKGDATYTAPAGMSFTSVGVVGFTVTNLAQAGDSAIVRIVLPTGTNPSGYVKCDAGTKVCAVDPLFPALTAADLKDSTKQQGYFISGDSILLKLTDGVKPGDSDGAANQQITDPGAPIAGASTAAAGGGGGGGAFGALLLLPLGAMAWMRRRRLKA